MQANTDSILSFFKVIFRQVSQKEDIIQNTSPKTSNVHFLSLIMHAIPEETDCVKLQEKSTNNKEKNLTFKIIQKDNYIDIKTPHVQDF